MWQERADYGHFFYRIPNGESAADAYDRISGFNESLWRQFGEDDFASVCILGSCSFSKITLQMVYYILLTGNSNSWPYEQSFPHEMVPLLRRVLRRPA